MSCMIWGHSQLEWLISNIPKQFWSQAPWDVSISQYGPSRFTSCHESWHWVDRHSGCLPLHLPNKPRCWATIELYRNMAPGEGSVQAKGIKLLLTSQSLCLGFWARCWGDTEITRPETRDLVFSQGTNGRGDKLFTGHFYPKQNELHPRTATNLGRNSRGRERLSFNGLREVAPQFRGQVLHDLGLEQFCSNFLGLFACVRFVC